MGKSKTSNRQVVKPATDMRKITIKDQKDVNEYIDTLLRLSTTPPQSNIQKSLENHREIVEVLDKIKRNQDICNKSSTDNNHRYSSTTINEFVEWLKRNDAEFTNCSIYEFEGFDLGLKANADINEDSLIIAVPRKLMMSINEARNSILAPLIEKDQILKSMTNVTLAIFLLMEKFNRDSFWKPYINILPKKYTTVLYFSIEELEELKGSPTLEMALRQIKSITRQYAYFHKLFSSIDNPVCRLMRSRFTYSEYCWAVSTVMTRQNTIPFESGFHALIPLWDLCNHTNGRITTTYNPVMERSECFALKNFKVNEQIFIFYGIRSNADLFIHNGFVFEANEHDKYWIRLGVSKSDPLQEKRNGLLKKLQITNSGDFAISKGPIDGQLLAFLRIFNMNEEQLQYWLESERITDLSNIVCCDLDTVLEKKAWSFLLARLKLLLNTYKTSLEDDEKLIKLKGLPSNRLLAVKMRTTEKRIINYNLQYVEQHTK